MKKYIFKTSINCGGCLKRVKPLLDRKEGISKWEINLEHPDKILEVDTETLTPSDIINLVDDAGFEIELIETK